MIQVQKNFGTKIKSLFEDKKYSDLSILKRRFRAPIVIEDSGILFVGLNPSYSQQKTKVEQELINGPDFYNLYEPVLHPYFRKFPELAGPRWGHLDILFLRETKQKNILDFLNTPLGREFAWENVQITKSILETCRPKVIVVENTLARVLLGAEKKGNERIWMDYGFEFDNTIGTDRIKTRDSNLYDIPVFFTSMLTGQRALDNGSFTRLKWHVGRVLETNLNFNETSKM